eukprot:183428_1
MISIQNTEDDTESIFFVKINANFASYIDSAPTHTVISLQTIEQKPTEPLLKKTKRKTTFQSLQISVIRQPLSTAKGKKRFRTTCCLCCVDLVDPLSLKERVMKLTIGYIRMHCKLQFSADLQQLCIEYVGTENAYNWSELASIKKERKRKCLDCWKGIISILCAFVLLLSILGIYFGKDIVVLVINSRSNCDNALDVESKYVDFGVSTWIWSGCIAHLCGIGITVLSVLMLTCDVNSFFDNVCEIVCGDYEKCCTCCFSLFCGCSCCFGFCWLIIGLLLYSEMSRDDDVNLECSNAVLSWSILQIVESLISTGGACYVGWNQQ